MKRVFLIVLDSFGIGEMEDAEAYGDKGTNTLRSVSSSSVFSMPNMEKLGLFNIEGVTCRDGVKAPRARIARMKEASKGKDTTIGHWEIAGIVSRQPLPTYPEGFPEEVLEYRVYEKQEEKLTLVREGSVSWEPDGEKQEGSRFSALNEMGLCLALKEEEALKGKMLKYIEDSAVMEELFQVM